MVVLSSRTSRGALLELAPVRTLLVLLILMAVILVRVLCLGSQERTGEGTDYTVAHFVAAVKSCCAAGHGAHEASLSFLAWRCVGVGVGVVLACAGLGVVRR